jgi:hypothetical protein
MFCVLIVRGCSYVGMILENNTYMLMFISFVVYLDENTKLSRWPIFLCVLWCIMSENVSHYTSLHMHHVEKYFKLNLLILAGPSGRAVESTYCLRPPEHSDHGFESRSRHGCVSAFFCVVLSCVGRGLASVRSPMQGVLQNVQIDL